jgi:prepilin-type N-terminal cleavage/methylation domain-containing protein/prepilin-type processing-associated H-X9-DG protein
MTIVHRLCIRRGLSLVELLVVSSLLGIIMAMTMPAIQAVRESARRISCQNNLRQIALALSQYESAHAIYPSGSAFETEFSWASRCLPFFEQTSIYQQLDFKQNWNDPVNQPWIEQTLSLFQCPSSLKDYAGLTDYSGISGSWLSVSPQVPGSRNGMLFESLTNERDAVRVADVTDGMSYTIIVAESALLLEDNGGWWASGLNCISHDDGGINNPSGSTTEIASFHPGGANAVMCDASVTFLTNQLAPQIVGAYCTRSQGDFVK